MPRPIKWRCVGFIPEITYFRPAGKPLRRLEEICFSLEEAEAIRLKDLEGLEQEKCAERMRISRPTFHRVLASARNKVADALISGKAIRIEGGGILKWRCVATGVLIMAMNGMYPLRQWWPGRQQDAPGAIA